MSNHVQFSPVSGKPRQSQEILQTERRKNSSGRHEKTVSKSLKDSEDKSADEYSCGSSEYTTDDLESSQASTVRKNHEAGRSPYIDHEKGAAGHSLDGDQVTISRESGGDGDIDRVSDFQERDVSAVSSRSHSSDKSSSTSTWSVRRTSLSSDTGTCSPVQLPHRVLHLGVQTNIPASDPDKSDSAAEVHLILVL